MRKTLAVVVALTAIIAPAAPAHAATTLSGNASGYVINVNSGLAMAVYNASTANGAPVVQWQKSLAAPDNDVMVFESQSATSNWYRIKPLSGMTNNIRTDKCLVVQGASNADNAPIIQYTCSYDDNVNNDVWLSEEVYYSGVFYGYQFRNLKSNKCLVVQGAKRTNGAALIQYNCEAGAGAPYNELWTIQ